MMARRSAALPAAACGWQQEEEEEEEQQQRRYRFKTDVKATLQLPALAAAHGDAQRLHVQAAALQACF